jgi:glycosyltransferase involved in cell wall biosynthesis
MFIESPTVSVIISANNDHEYLLETIISVRQQTFADFEVLICHSGDSPGLVRWFKSQQDPRLKLFLEEDLDRVQMLNLAIKGARGKYIALIQGDDLWHPDKLQKQVFYLDRYPAIGLVHSWLTEIDEESKSTGKIIKQKLSGWVESAILQRNQVNFSSATIRRDCFETIGLFDPNLQTSFDWDLWIRLSRAYQFIAIAKSLVYYRQYQNRVNEIWLTREKDLQGTIEKAYQNTPLELLALKNRSYGYASLSLAGEVLQTGDSHLAIVNHYCRQALEHSPRISFSREFMQIRLAVFSLYCLKSDRLLALGSSIQMIGSGIQAILHKFKASTHFLWRWTFQEKVINHNQQRVRSKEREIGNEG